MMMMVIACSLLSACPLALACMMLDTSSSNCSHSLRLFAGGHLICCCGTTLLGLGHSSTWRDWELWGSSFPGSSCISPGHGPVAPCSPAQDISFWCDGFLGHTGSCTACCRSFHFILVDSLFAGSLTLGPSDGEPPPLSSGLSVACWGSFPRKIQAGVLTHTVLGAVFLSC